MPAARNPPEFLGLGRSAEESFPLAERHHRIRIAVDHEQRNRREALDGVRGTVAVADQAPDEGPGQKGAAEHGIRDAAVGVEGAFDGDAADAAPKLLALLGDSLAERREAARAAEALAEHE